MCFVNFSGRFVIKHSRYILNFFPQPPFLLVIQISGISIFKIDETELLMVDGSEMRFRPDFQFALDVCIFIFAKDIDLGNRQ
jgi:hypothetical protein